MNRSTTISPQASASGATDGPLSGGSPIETFPGIHARTRRFTLGQPRNITVLGRQRVLFLRSQSGTDTTLCLWRLDLKTGVEEVVVDPGKLHPATAFEADDELPAAERARRERARESSGGIVAYSVDRRGKKACFSLNGTLYLVDLRTREVMAPAVADAVFDPRLSPDGSKIAYVSGNDLRLYELADGSSDRPLAHSTSPTVSYGRAEFVAAEEMGRARGFWWSPSGDRLLVSKVDETPVASWWIADPAHPEREPNNVRYPVAGSSNALVELAVFDLKGNRRPMGWDDDERYEYLADVVWGARPAPLIVRQTRDQREVSVAEADPESLELSERRRITDETWVELIPGSPTVCDAGILTVEDITTNRGPVGPYDPGRRSLMLDGRPLTDDGINVRSIVGVTRSHVIVTAWTVPTEIHLFAVGLDGGADDQQAVVALTTEAGVHTATLGAAAATAEPDNETDSWAGPGDPADAAGEDRSDADEAAPLLVVTTARTGVHGTRTEVRPFRVDGDGPRLEQAVATIADVSEPSPIQVGAEFLRFGPDRLETAVFLPTGYEGEHPLPVLLDPYGGPHTQRVLKTNNAHLVSQWFAEQGFAVVVTDGRGTPGRGPAWERQVWGDLAEPILEDQLAALEHAAEEYEFCDMNRVAIRGWSFGGYLAALAVLRRPDRFHAAIAGAPVTTWRLYDTHYTERYLGHPDFHPQNYQGTDLTAEAEKLNRPLLLIHGLADDNVVAAHTLRMSTALLAAAAPHRVLPLSGVTHMTPQEVVAENLLWLQLDFLRQSLEIGSTTSPGSGAGTGAADGTLRGR